MKVLVGHKGYICSHLVDLLQSAGHSVNGCNLGLFGGRDWRFVVPANRDLNKDVETDGSVT